MLTLFHTLIAIHIAFGAVGLVSFWVPVVGRKGDRMHRLWGKVFAVTILVAGSVALCLASLTLIDPMATHPHLTAMGPELVRGIFGVMMFYLAVLTINLAWYGQQTIRNKRDHARNRQGLNLALQPTLLTAAIWCVAEGLRIGQPLMIGISTIGFATVATNAAFMLARSPGPKDYLREHVKAIVGAGISVYTAFLAFGAVRIMPDMALHPGLWALPLVTGLAIILWHWRKLGVGLLPRRPASDPAGDSA
jgi:hypothetical protein